ncbi:hypothetical protein K490DRAFT_40934 [Saccharata proteae CBS 121410]|uniref:Glycine cleavage system H protein n=1 Tax=Saccharata proteae CBS 121410 TaxID=1314787 RepID=A0A9P4HTV5_9PEZI|nr:hypothetical protein K490DRAFT_40934 [Saccharata proteae CBS 121410]
MAARTPSIARAAVRQFSSALSRPAFVCNRAVVSRPQQQLRYRPFSISAALAEKKFTKDHEWVELSEDGKTFTLGITAYAADALGDVVYVELPEAGSEFSAEDTIGSVESVKSTSDILTPLPGTVTEANSVLEDKPSTINKSPEGEGWIARVQLADGADMEGLMSQQDYTDYVGKPPDEA